MTIKQLLPDSDSESEPTTPVKKTRGRPRKFPVKEKGPRGRPQIYETDEERSTARAEKRRLYNARYYEKKMNELK